MEQNPRRHLFFRSRGRCLFNEAESCADPDAPEPGMTEVEAHLRKKKYAGQREKLVKNIPHSKV